MGHDWRIIALLVCAGALGCASGCGSHGPRRITDEDPADKIPAIKQAARTGDRRAIPHLVKDLESDDPAVRFYAIDALKTLTGETFGYRYYAEEDLRKPAVEQWKKWIAERYRTSKH